MPNTSPVILILGAGSNIGNHVARAFAAKGYKVALAARRLKEADNNADQINIPSDLSDPSSVVNAFSKVKSLLGVPSVVIYNGEDCYQGHRRISTKVSKLGQ
jgi:NAD(P)-dependent dehydrogenase (short-subunit alcohol dehydrogenase family)